MLFINLTVHWDNVSPKIKKNDQLYWPHHNKIIKEIHFIPIRF